jgi:hypothetical protein
VKKTPSLLFAASLLFVVACGKSMKMHMQPSQQGLYGTFKAYYPLPEDQKRNCEPLKTQAEKDECRKFNSRTLEEPLQAVLRIRNLATDSSLSVMLDSQGSYKALLSPGTYEVCLSDECSDPLEVTMNVFVPYGGRQPKK